MGIIKKKKIKVPELISKLCAVDEKRLTVFSTDDAFRKIRKYRVLFHHISRYCSICDYELLEAFVESTCCQEAIEVLNAFTDEMRNSILKELNLLSECGDMLNPDDLMPGTYKFAIKYIGSSQCTLETKNVTLFWKTDHVVTFSISKNTDFKYSMGCSSPMVQYSHARPTTLSSLVI